MCLTEVGKLHRALIGLEIDLEPTSKGAGHGTLTSVRTIPACPGFRHLTIRSLTTGTGVERVVPNSLLVYVYCRSRAIFPARTTDTREEN